MEIMMLIDYMQLTMLFKEGKWKLLVNYQVTTHQILECFQVRENMSPLYFNINVYTLSVIKTA